MAKFCGKCGSRLDETTGLCPNCDAEKLAAIRSEESTDKGKEQEAHSDAPRLIEPGQETTTANPEKKDGSQNSEPVSIDKHLSKKEAKKQRKKEKKAAKRASKKAKRASWSLGKKIRRFVLKLLLSFLLIAVLASCCLGALVYFDVIDIPVIEDVLNVVGLKTTDLSDSDLESEFINLDDYKVDSPDAEDYFQQNSQIVNAIDVSDSEGVLTEAESSSTFGERGFKDYPITTEYSMDGNYNDATEISNSSSVKHPMYQTYYVNDSDELWIISLIDGDIVANPVSYNMQSALETQLIVSESEIITSYDSSTNKYYKTVPNESTLIVRIVDKIDADTLDTLTIEELGK